MQKKEIMEETLQIKILTLEMKAQKIREQLANKMLRDKEQISKIKN